MTTITTDWITVADAAVAIGVSTRRIRQLVEEKRIKAQKISPRFLLVSTIDVEREAAEVPKTGRPRGG